MSAASRGGGRPVLVTGGGSGIGAATCAVLAEHGWTVVAADVKPPAGGVALDVTDEAGWERVMADTGPLAGLVCCAGIRTRSMIVDTAIEEFRRHLDVNVVGTWLAIRSLLRHHMAGTGAAIVTIASVNATIAVPGSPTTSRPRGRSPHSPKPRRWKGHPWACGPTRSRPARSAPR